MPCYKVIEQASQWKQVLRSVEGYRQGRVAYIDVVCVCVCVGKLDKPEYTHTLSQKGSGKGPNQPINCPTGRQQKGISAEG